MNPSSATLFHSDRSDHSASDSRRGGDAPILVGIDDVARLLNLSSRTVWTLTTKGDLPHVRIGRRVLYPVEAIRQWIARRVTVGDNQAG